MLNLQWCEPQAMEPWEGIKDTTKFGPIAPQNSKRRITHKGILKKTR